MSIENPTPLRIGMTGTLADTRYRVAGRIVMGMEEGGETYYWNEFSLVDDAGDAVTLVYEESDDGGSWKLFTLFEPDHPMTLREAEAKRVGETVQLDGQAMRVTLVDESCVHHIEGEAPEGVESGDVAHYFNAETGSKMIVASWTGEELEFYRGVDLPRGVVAAAFGLGSELPPARARREGKHVSPGTNVVVVSSCVLVGALVVFAAIGLGRSASRQPAIVRTGAPPAPLSLGSVGRLEGRDWRVTGRALVEISQVGLLYDRHEYSLAGDDGSHALLVCGFRPGAQDWVLFTPLQPAEPLSPHEAAAKRAGEVVNVDGNVATVGALLQSVVRETEGVEPRPEPGGTLRFGFTGQTGSTLLLARWHKDGIVFHRGKTLPAKQAVEAFSLKLER